MKTELDYSKKRKPSKLARLAYVAAIIASLSVVWALVIRPALPAVDQMIAVTRQPVILNVIVAPTSAPVVATSARPAAAPATAASTLPINVAPADTTNQAAAVYNENPALAEACMAAASNGRRMSPQCKGVLQRMGQGR